ncbi:DUF1990 family protein [Actinomycetospora sp. NBRC 106378]|uniref:DUF1990 family protein n=1 Tax=Actinomycetospora sp. NBRC 106378 TaxID=3032208 RepID=UPI0024A03CDF|nr:DUF1990 family protein [Actinomycetospora sp. NBRC 106378]GLZ50551.1 hypothetical protein Acsp07_01680 [Actinomycetospora sp. NBRC 106378]
MHLVPGPRQVAREARMLTSAPRGLLALGRIWALPGVRVNHREEPGDPVTDAPPPLPTPGPRDQTLLDGHGPMLHRVFTVHVPDARLGPLELVAVLVADINAAMIPGAARFDRVTGSAHALTVGDEYVVRIPGPWDGPVRVVDRTDQTRRSSFRLATLEGHVEAGQIEFAAEGAGDEEGGDTALQFSITTWARAGDVLADLMYNRLRLAKNLQFQLWVHCCVRAAELAGGEPEGGVEVVTRTVEWSDELARMFSAAG